MVLVGTHMEMWILGDLNVQEVPLYLQVSVGFQEKPLYVRVSVSRSEWVGAAHCVCVHSWLYPEQLGAAQLVGDIRGN